MTAKILDGKALAKKIEQEVQAKISTLSYKPCLHVIIAGDDPASKIYVGRKESACARVGIESKIHHFKSCTTKDLVDLVSSINSDDRADGILVQLPLPKNVDSNAVTFAISPDKDVDGFHPTNVGRLALGQMGLRPCTPFGIMRLLGEYGVDVAGKKSVIVGRSNIVGKPMALMLLEKNSTVTICHSKTRFICDEIKSADIVVAAVGKPAFVQGDWIKPGAVVIDVGINRLDDGKLVGDVDFESASKNASLITPVPGGVGPLTVAMLLQNTIDAALDRRKS